MMSEQHYATPQADLTKASDEIAPLLTPLENTKSWVRICSIIGFISTGLFVLAGIGLIIAGKSTINVPTGTIVGTLYIAMSALYFFPSFYLHQYANEINRALIDKSLESINTALEKQKSFWKFVGIVAIIMLSVTLLGIVAAIVIPILAS